MAVPTITVGSLQIRLADMSAANTLLSVGSLSELVAESRNLALDAAKALNERLPADMSSLLSAPALAEIADVRAVIADMRAACGLPA